MGKLKNKKTIGIVIILIMVISISILTYGKNNNSIFKDKYMDNIFIEDDNKEFESGEIIIDGGENNIAESSNLNLEEKINEKESLIVVEIKGEVVNPDVYTLNEGSIVKDLIDMAGGLTTEADISNINRAKEIKNHELIIIKNINDKTTEDEVIEDSISEEVIDDTLISINNSDIEQLKEIPGIGEVKAKAIISYRESNGEFRSIDELKNVDGIGEKTFEKIKDNIKL